MRAGDLCRAAVHPLAAVTVLAVLAVGCAGAQEPQVEQSPTATADDAASAPVGEQVPGQAVAVSGFRFAPESVAVAAGAAVTWTNDDATRHTVTPGRPEASSEAFSPLELEGTGATGTVPFAQPGTYPYFCSVHPSMTGEVVVR